MLQRGRLSALGPEHEANGGYKHAARVFEAMSFGKADDIERRIQLLLPFATVLISEIGTLVFVAIALAHRVTGNDPQQRTGRREVPHPTLSRVAARKPLTNHAKAFGATLGEGRQAEVNAFVMRFRAEHQRTPTYTETRLGTGLGAGTVSRCLARVA